ncbi:heme ABC exporter ATP-binding protein CcmA [Pseudaminobacter soli (ex Li et al. 2025)]|uniref:Heme ABC exporter ATP-binding protein CcmA n=1 Tax=Pseudaminobacter soli (ex Li et al. 2025) TaxID=1295366 RepID=A0A2P7SHW4_9HYPH|nr:heme ABC exporter ATP-binding protein CcmA [Mesorhizobium soli]PSJ62073.1 heme ABC exporter ATP-binding protein CcmA [Mesorhizobium soli]
MRLIAEEIEGRRAGETIFSGIGFTLGEGDGLIVTGPNGAGKSTLLRVVAGLLPLAHGRLEFEDGGEDFPSVESACHYLGPDNAMKTALTVSENLAFWQSFFGRPHLSILEALEMVGLETIGHLPFGYLSTGQRRRVSIAKLMVSHRPVWLLDEPTSGLDKHSEAQFSELMRMHLLGGGMIVAATHLPLGLEGVQELRMGGH